MSIQFSDFTFVPDDHTDGNGTVLVPLVSVGYDLAGLGRVSVVDSSGRSVVYDGCGRTYFTDSAAGTEEFVGWSYFEEEATEDLDGPCVQLMVLSPDYDVADYPGVTL